jgi:hypothetical protein
MTAVTSGESWSRLASMELRMPRVRVTVQGLLIAVAALGILIWLGMWRERHLLNWRFHGNRAGRERVLMEQELANLNVYKDSDQGNEAFQESLERFRSNASLVRKMRQDRLAFKKLVATMARNVEQHQRLLEHHTRLKEKYSYAASHPWLPVSPDPPEPK